MASMLHDHRTMQRRFRFFLIWIGYWLFLFFIMHIQIPTPVSLGKGSDKIAHFVLYAALAILGGLSLHPRDAQDRRIRKLIGWAFVYAGYGVLDEYLQSYVGRTCSAADWLADICGIVAGTIVIGLWSYRSQTNKPSL